MELKAMAVNAGLEPGAVKLKVEIPSTAASFRSLEPRHALAKIHDWDLQHLEIHSEASSTPLAASVADDFGANHKDRCCEKAMANMARRLVRSDAFSAE